MSYFFSQTPYELDVCSMGCEAAMAGEHDLDSTTPRPTLSRDVQPALAGCAARLAQGLTMLKTDP